MSYLFKYPVSKLNPIESAQVETLISTLTLLKPEMRASDIVTLGTGLLVSVSGRFGFLHIFEILILDVRDCGYVCTCGTPI